MQNRALLFYGRRADKQPDFYADLLTNHFRPGLAVAKLAVDVWRASNYRQEFRQL